MEKPTGNAQLRLLVHAGIACLATPCQFYLHQLQKGDLDNEIITAVSAITDGNSSRVYAAVRFMSFSGLESLFFGPKKKCQVHQIRLRLEKDFKEPEICQGWNFEISKRETDVLNCDQTISCLHTFSTFFLGE